MSYSNETPNYKLPLFSPSDKPSWLGAWNTAMTNIDTGLSSNVSATDLITNSVNKLQTAITELESELQESNEQVTDLQTKVQALETTDYIPIVNSIFGTIAPVQYSTENNMAKMSLESFIGGFVRLSFADPTENSATQHNVNYSIAIDSYVQSTHNFLVTGNETDGLNFKTDTFFVPPGSDFYFIVSVDNNAPSSEYLTVETATYATKAIGKTMGEV